jgi:hypothetical protein
LKGGSVKAPDVYLGAEVKQFKIPESDEPGKIRWAMSSSKYVARAVKDVKTELENVGLGLPKRTTTPLSQGYRPELDRIKPRSWMLSDSIITRDWLASCDGFVNLGEWTF